MSNTYLMPEKLTTEQQMEVFTRLINADVRNGVANSVFAHIDVNKMLDVVYAAMLDVAALTQAPAPTLTGEVETPAPVTHLRGLADAIAERVRQIEAEGWTTEHDDSHEHGEMARAAAAYCLGQHELMGRVQDGKRFLPWRSMIWPWSKEWWKPKTRREDLIRAAALIIAEIERLDRAALAATEGSDNG